ncbi:MAG: hypothetical protein H3C47_02540 [Candidatus Cloacimonetes bacterium]|nr:hypothetical protein [Candidatus Cloacimonadota bacterium]
MRYLLCFVILSGTVIAADIMGSIKNMVTLSAASDVLVWLEVDNPGAVEPITAHMRQQEKEFHPRQLLVPVGSVVYFPNEDPFFHNIFSHNAIQKLELGQYKGQGEPVTFEKPGIYPIGCEIHPWMAAHILVVNSPFYTQSDATGKFNFSGVPEGKLKLHYWTADMRQTQVRDYEVKASRNVAFLTIEQKMLRRKKREETPVNRDIPASAYE